MASYLKGGITKLAPGDVDPGYTAGKFGLNPTGSDYQSSAPNPFEPYYTKEYAAKREAEKLGNPPAPVPPRVGGPRALASL